MGLIREVQELHVIIMGKNIFLAADRIPVGRNFKREFDKLTVRS